MMGAFPSGFVEAEVAGVVTDDEVTRLFLFFGRSSFLEAPELPSPALDLTWLRPSLP